MDHLLICDSHLNKPRRLSTNSRHPSSYRAFNQTSRTNYISLSMMYVRSFFGRKQVACRQLGFLGAKRYYTHGGGTGPTWLDELNCQGTEKSLVDCKHPGIGVENCG